MISSDFVYGLADFVLDNCDQAAHVHGIESEPAPAEPELEVYLRVGDLEVVGEESVEGEIGWR